ncbi:MAG TPA: guanylate kinase [Cyclobacteriaceae bacterium]|nr:guanylate kinase [Cyclobacteriaceae bacterium]
MMAGKALIFSAPSGSGKTTIVKHLLKNNSDLGFSISASTRDRRGRTEQDGKDYHFLTPEEFKEKIDNDEFIEWEEVYAGNFYGTLKTEIERIWSEGKNVIFDVDVKGGINLKKYFGENALAVFVKVPSIEILKARLQERGTESEESLSRRLFKAKFEMTFQDKFDVVLVNEDLDKSLSEAQKLYDQFKARP